MEIYCRVDVDQILFYLSKLYSFLLFYQIHRNINTSKRKFTTTVTYILNDRISGKKKSLYNNLYVIRKNKYIYLEFQCLVSFSWNSLQ